MTKARDLLRILAQFEESTQSVGIDLRLDLADLVMKHLDLKGWTQKMLAEKTGMHESFISRIIHADSNCQFEVAGRIMHALGVRIKLQQAASDRLPFARPGSTAGSTPFVLKSQDTTYGPQSSHAEATLVFQATTGGEHQDSRLAKGA